MHIRYVEWKVLYGDFLEDVKWKKTEPLGGYFYHGDNIEPYPASQMESAHQSATIGAPSRGGIGYLPDPVRWKL